MEEELTVKKKAAIYDYLDYRIELYFIDNTFRIYKNDKKVAFSTKEYKSKNSALKRAQETVNVLSDKIEILK